jgi:uncharacterized protein
VTLTGVIALPLKPETYALQSELARAVRGGVTSGDFPLQQDRVAVYRGLIGNVFDDTLKRAYPVCFRLLGSVQWKKLIDEFLREHPASSPELWQMPRELLSWVEASGYSHRSGYPYLRDLLYFEWMEIELFMMPDSLPDDWQSAVRSWKEYEPRSIAAVNTDSKLITLNYPVFNASRSSALTKEGNYFLIVFRHPERLDACYVEASPFFALFWELLCSEELPLEQIGSACADALQIEYTSDLEKQCAGFCEMLCSEGLILGYKKNRNDEY